MSAWTSIASLDTPTSGTFTFTGLSLSTFKRIRIELIGITVTTDGTDIGIQTSHGSGFVTTGYIQGEDAESSSDTANGDQATGLSIGLIVGNDGNWDVGNAATKGAQAQVEIADPGSTSLHKMGCFDTCAQGPTTNVIITIGAFTVANAGAIDGIKVIGTSNITAGKVRIWGMT